jgi:outer membrane protein TolC
VRNTVTAGIARSRSARAGKEAAFPAAEQARQSYRTGTISQLDLLQAQRDACNAESESDPSRRRPDQRAPAIAALRGWQPFHRQRGGASQKGVTRLVTAVTLEHG